MATQLLASGTTATTSGDIEVVAGSPVTVSLKDAAGAVVPTSAIMFVQLKDDAGQYFTVDRLTYARPSLVLAGPGAYRLSRPVNAVAVGAFSG